MCIVCVLHVRCVCMPLTCHAELCICTCVHMCGCCAHIPAEGTCRINCKQRDLDSKIPRPGSDRTAIPQTPKTLETFGRIGRLGRLESFQSFQSFQRFHGFQSSKDSTAFQSLHGFQSSKDFTASNPSSPILPKIPRPPILLKISRFSRSLGSLDL